MPLDKIREVIVAILNCPEEQIIPSANLREDLGADSLDAVELVMELENAYGVAISEEETRNLQTVGDIINYIESHT